MPALPENDAHLARLLVARGLVDDAHLRALLARRPPGDATPLARLIVAAGLIDEPTLAALVAEVRRSTGPRTVGTAPLTPARTAPLASARRTPSTGPLATGAFAPGDSIALSDGTLRCERLLGEGGMGVVYLVTDPRLGRPAALKLIRGTSGPRREARFRRETVVTARLDHPGIPPVYEAGRTADGMSYLLMRFVDGRSLEDLIRTRRPGPIDDRARELLAALVKVAEAVAYAHSRGVVHRDLKPDNVMVGAFGEVLVMDWGLARDLRETPAEDALLRQELQDGLEAAPAAGLTADGAIVGTLGYMAPEQAASADVDARADVYALGAILTCALTGEPPIRAESALDGIRRTAEGQVELPRSRRRDVPGELDAIAERALRLRPEDRYPTAEAFAADLRAWLEGRRVDAHRYGALERAGRFARAHPTLVAVAAVAFVLSGLAVGAVAAGAARARTAERSALVDAARDDAETAAGRLAQTSLPAELDAATAPEERHRLLAPRVTQALAAFVAAQRWHALAPGDRAAATARFDAALALGEAARLDEQWSLAERAYDDAASVGVDDARARTGREAVETARTAEASRRREEVEAVLARAEAGELVGEVGGLEDAVLRILRYPEAATVALVAARLDAVSAALVNVERAVWLEARDPTPEETRAGEGRIEGIAAALDRVRGQAIHETPLPADEAVLERARRRIEQRAFNRGAQRFVDVSDGPRRPTRLLALVATRQARALGLGRLSLARVCCEALGRMGIRAGAIAALDRHLRAEASPARAVEAALALCRLDGPDALIAVLRGRRRFRRGHFMLRTAIALHGVEEDPPLVDDGPEGHRIRAELRRIMRDGAGALEDVEVVLATRPEDGPALAEKAGLLDDLDRSAEADAVWRRLLAVDPTHPRALEREAGAREAAGDLEGAIDLLGRALRAHPDDGQLLLRRALLRARRGDRSGAIADITVALEEDPDDVQSWTMRGTLRLGLGDATGAALDLTEALERDPGWVGARRNRAALRLNVGDHRGALLDVDRALEQDPESADLHDLRARALTGLGRATAAVEAIERAIALAPGDAALQTRRADLMRTLGDLDASEADARAALERDPRSAGSWVALGNTHLEREEWREAADAFSRALAIAPGDAEVLSNRAVALHHIGDFQGANRDFDEAIRIDPELTSAVSGRAHLRLRTGNLDGALRDMQTAVRLRPENAGLHMNLGVAQLLRGETDAAIAAFDAAIALEPDLAMLYVERGRARGMKGDFDGAMADYSIALAKDPTRADAWAFRGEVKRYRGDLEGGIADAEQALRYAPGLSAAHMVRGEALFHLGRDVDRARADLRKVIELSPTSQEAEKARAMLAELDRRGR